MKPWRHVMLGRTGHTHAISQQSHLSLCPLIFCVIIRSWSKIKSPYRYVLPLLFDRVLHTSLLLDSLLWGSTVTVDYLGSAILATARLLEYCVLLVFQCICMNSASAYVVRARVGCVGVGHWAKARPTQTVGRGQGLVWHWASGSCSLQVRWRCERSVTATQSGVVFGV